MSGFSSLTFCLENEQQKVDDAKSKLDAISQQEIEEDLIVYCWKDYC